MIAYSATIKYPLGRLRKRSSPDDRLESLLIFHTPFLVQKIKDERAQDYRAQALCWA
jgi:hypothetical protein